MPYGRQNINNDDIDAVCRVLESELITQGPVVERFEAAMAEHCGASHAVAVNSATSALHIACLALEVGLGDTVWTTPNTFVASANCVRYCQADVDFVDIDLHSYNMCPVTLAAKLEHALEHGLPMPRVVIVVHFAGESCDMEKFAALARKFDFALIEDASHAVGGHYQQKPVGSCVYSDITVFSFHPVKIITSGEGGMALTNNDTLAQRMRLFRTHGVSRPGSFTDLEPWVYEQWDIGYNYRMTDIHAALGLSQMRRLDQFVDRRHELAQRYRELLADLPFVLPENAGYARSAIHLYPILVPDAVNRKEVRFELYLFLQNNGIGVNVHYIPVHTQPYYQNLGFRAGDYPVAENYYQRTVSLPIFGCMSDAEQDRVAGLLHEFVEHSDLALAA